MEGVARALFSGPIAANDADSTEVGAVFIALDLFLSMGWNINSSLIVEIDIERKIEQVGSVVFSMVDQKGNEMASTLAIAGINRGDMFKAC
ncbi:hypothetical protein Gogos_020445 [Gossypium gossypioides]|uniref:RNase H type-1 domain-containing protein n=1 Tax=Gossypium gossypioides TaxID=34282 RepID=A0A7J9D4J0_GOSGO|nr:hypothetical protein [Gossypium gossypioides]